MEEVAIGKIRQELQKAKDHRLSISSLSVKIKWGQGDLENLGPCRSFLQKFPEVFELEKGSVVLRGAAAAAPEREAPKAREPGPASAAADEDPKAKRRRLEEVASTANGGGGATSSTTPATPPATPLSPVKAALPELSTTDGDGAGEGDAAAGLLAPGPNIVRGTPAPKHSPAEAPQVSETVGPCPAGVAPESPVAAADNGVNKPTNGETAAVAEADAKATASCSRPSEELSQVQSSAEVQPAESTAKQSPAAEPTRKAEVKTVQEKPKRPGSWKEDTLSREELTKILADCKSVGVELELRSLLARVSPTGEFRKACQQCYLTVQSQVEQTQTKCGTINAEVLLVGSHAQGTHLEGSDMDILLRLSGDKTKKERQAFLRSLREGLQGASTQFSVTEPAHLRRSEPALLTLEATAAGPSVVAHLFVAQDEELSANGDRQSVDAIVKALCDHFEPTKDIVRLVKLWAVNHGLVGDHISHMTGLAWTLLVLFFLQKDGRLPAFSALPPERASPAEGARPPPLTELLGGFFCFLTGRSGAPPAGVSVISGEGFPLPAGHEIFVEDPAERLSSGERLNLAASLGQDQWTRVLQEAVKAADRLTMKPQRWFNWAEIFDSREGTLKKLEPLGEVIPGVAIGIPGIGDPLGAFARGAALAAGQPPPPSFPPPPVFGTVPFLAPTFPTALPGWPGPLVC